MCTLVKWYSYICGVNITAVSILANTLTQLTRICYKISHFDMDDIAFISTKMILIFCDTIITQKAENKLSHRSCPLHMT